jgi:uncharacterized surface protein with fasciclin (FAS1) repeats
MLLCVGLLAGCHKTSIPQAKPDATYYDRQAFVLPINANLVAYDSMMKLTGLIDTLEQAGPYTPFVLDNNAMNQAGWGYIGSNGTVSSLNPPPNIVNLLSSMIFRGAHYLDSTLPVATNQVWTPLTGVPAYISKYLYQGDTLYSFNGVQVTQQNYPTSNGPMQVLDGPPNIQAYSTISEYINSAQQFTFLSVALQRSGLNKLLSDSGPWTLLAPDNGVFQSSTDPSLNSLDSLLTADTAKLANLLRFHILPGRMFLFDFNIQAGALANGSNGTTDSIRLYALNGIGLDYINQSGTPYFYGAGDISLQYDYNTGNYDILAPTPISLGGSTNQIVGNGIVHELNSGFLLP